jgi:protein-S-isoprenylcysteine O-methyltransferase Ste14
MKRWNFSGAILGASVLIVAQYILAFFVFPLSGMIIFQWIGWGIWLLSLYFGIAPIFIFRKKGGVDKGKSYVETTRLVDTDLYAIVRHPQYVGGILLSLALILISQQWFVIVLGIVSIVLFYLDMWAADQQGIEKFGDQYRSYMQKVPRANFVLGLIRLLKNRTV